MKLKTFKLGGVHPPENKKTADIPVVPVEIPKRVSVIMSQHLGVPAAPVVDRGDKVKVGTLIGEAKGFISANIHSPVSGTIFKVDAVTDATGYRKNAVIINVEGDDREEKIDKSETLVKEIKLSPEEIIQRIKDSGIVGMGGAAFPTHVKYMFPEGKTADTLVINGVECEPYLTSDHRVMVERADEVLIGVTIMMKAGKVNRALIGIEANKPDAIKILSEKAKEFQGIEVVPLKVQYPQGAEKQLIKSLLNREIPSGKLPLDVGCIVNNIGTAFAIYEAVQKNKPLIERVVTLTGKRLKKGGNFQVRIGTPVKSILEKLGEELPDDTGKLISGGPMMGKAINTLDIPVTKGTSGIVFMDEDESERSDIQNCIRCSKCVSVCPMGLEPYLLEKLGEKEMFEECEKEDIVDCIECGSCSYTCPSSRQLLDYIRYGKQNVMRIMRERRQK